jgi:hypothetical protein
MVVNIRTKIIGSYVLNTVKRTGLTGPVQLVTFGEAKLLHPGLKLANAFSVLFCVKTKPVPCL